MFLTRISVEHPVFATMMMVAVVVFGFFALQRLGVDQYPKVDVPVVAISTTYSGASPEAVESDVTRPIEEVVNSISGIDTVTSNSYEGRSVVVVTFDLEVDGQAAAQDVRDKISPLEARFPDGVDNPSISRFNPTDRPILSIAVSSDRLSLSQLTTISDQIIVKRLNTVGGVGQATLVGGQKRQINILIDRSRMDDLGIGIDEVMKSLKAETENFPSGSLTSTLTERTVQVEGRVDDPKLFLNVIVARRGGSPVYLSDIAEIDDGEAEATNRALFNGKTAPHDLTKA